MLYTGPEVARHPENAQDALPSQITELLRGMQRGDRQASERACTLVYDELNRIAARELRRERPSHTLVTTALVHEAYMRLIGSESLPIRNRGHFFAIASQQMRRILVDYARARGAQKRDGGIPIGLDQANVGLAPPDIDLLALHNALLELERIEPRAAQVVELRYFGGYTDKEVVEATGVSLATVRRDWEFARCWLFDRIGPRNKRSRTAKT